MNANEEKKAKLRNFTFVESADRRLVELKQETGRDMTLILEDLLLGRRQFTPEIEQFLQSEIQRTGHPRNAIIETALANYKAKVTLVSAADSRLQDDRAVAQSNQRANQPGRKSRPKKAR